MLKKCLFLAGGYGTRFLPATKAMPKEMLPILDKPLIQYGVEEAVQAGLHEIGFVTGRGKRAIEDHFDSNFELENRIKGTSREEALQTLEELIDTCTIAYTRQGEILGTGHAVLCGRLLMGHEPFGVVLADDLCLNEGLGVLAQLVEVYRKYECCVVAVEQVAVELTNKYGIIDGVEQEDGTYLVNELVEKPEPENAPSRLGIVGRYILVPKIFDELERTEPGYGGEIQLTDALNALARTDRIVACAFDGIRFDCGSIEGFVEATNYCLQKRQGHQP
ncbi:MAG: UTP--glucose-1-phosphate uridylyltransferase GalU [Gammaproteobacteria bacterium]|nr:UTP--glucose-1-phosphate uridylyltransferase GalU [Gammaproteobacteria bacterium]MYD79480.1 UTP--glucose-1-phosphate uridylyltransferase GalU [Gammaproteobacteria bacterium]